MVRCNLAVSRATGEGQALAGGVLLRGGYTRGCARIPKHVVRNDRSDSERRPSTSIGVILVSDTKMYC